MVSNAISPPKLPMDLGNNGQRPWVSQWSYHQHGLSDTTTACIHHLIDRCHPALNMTQTAANLFALYVNPHLFNLSVWIVEQFALWHRQMGGEEWQWEKRIRILICGGLVSHCADKDFRTYHGAWGGWERGCHNMHGCGTIKSWRHGLGNVSCFYHRRLPDRSHPLREGNAPYRPKQSD